MQQQHQQQWHQGRAAALSNGMHLPEIIAHLRPSSETVTIPWACTFKVARNSTPKGQLIVSCSTAEAHDHRLRQI
jgi:hypothetical protein